jgi:hypothetical protein
MSSRGRFATPADFPLHDCSPYSHVHVRRRHLGFVHRPRTLFCRPVPNPNITIRNFCAAVRCFDYAPSTSATSPVRRVFPGWGHCRLKSRFAFTWLTWCSSVGAAVLTGASHLHQCPDEMREWPGNRTVGGCDLMRLPSSLSRTRGHGAGTRAALRACTTSRHTPHPASASTSRLTASRAQVFGVECLNLVGGATSAVEYAGPTIFEAADCVNKHGMVREPRWPLHWLDDPPRGVPQPMSRERRCAGTASGTTTSPAYARILSGSASVAL